MLFTRRKLRLVLSYTTTATTLTSFGTELYPLAIFYAHLPCNVLYFSFIPAGFEISYLLFLFIRLVRTNIISINKQQTQKSVFTQDSAFLARLASLFSTVFEMIQQHTFHRRHEVIKTRSFLSDHQEEFSPETRCT